jgi:tetratricopeptide (TPR) repeat protein
LRPQSVFALNRLAYILDVAGQFDAAVAELRAALRLNPNDALAHYNLALALERRGKGDEAVAELREAIRLNPIDARANFYLGSNLVDQGKLDEAIAAYRRAVALRKVSGGGGLTYWFAWALAQAERLAALTPRLPAILRGDEQPRDNQERLDFAQLCMMRRLYAAASRWHAEALEADPRLFDRSADRVKQQWRYALRGIRSAALAGCGQGDDAPTPDDLARSRLRTQALGWLKGELFEYSRYLQSSKSTASGRAETLLWLSFWEAEPDLAGVRDADALARLPEPERAAWTALWAEVDALLAKARGARP